MSIKVNIDRGIKGRGYWKLNSSILNNNDYVTLITNIISIYSKKSNNCKDVGVLWDNLKVEIRDESLGYCKQRARNTRDKIHNLEKKKPVAM